MNWRGFERKSSWPNRGSVRAYVWRRRGIRPENLPNTSLEYCRYAIPLGRSKRPALRMDVLVNRDAVVIHTLSPDIISVIKWRLKWTEHVAPVDKSVDAPLLNYPTP
jgi:hypothetical protein